MADDAGARAARGRRFYETARAVAEAASPGLWTVTLDGRPLRTPGRAAFVAPRAVAEAAAAEWAEQGASIEPASMPVTRAVNTAIERVAPQRGGVIDEVAAYAGSDLVCYRADGPETLVAQEAAAWDPWVRWTEETYGARLTVTRGVMHLAQPSETLATLRAAVAQESDLGLVALHDLTALSGSLVLALATRRCALAAEDAWRASRVDEDHQAALWGVDAEAAEDAERRRAAFLEAARLVKLIESS